MMADTDTRPEQLRHWVQQQPAFAGAALTPVSGDASFRRYYRATRPDGKTAIIMDAPPSHEDCGPFVSIARFWRQQGISTPEVLAEDLSQGFLLLEDFGDRLMLGCLDATSADRLYDQALAELLDIQRLPPDPTHPLPSYDAALLDREMALFRDWLLTRLLGLTLSNPQKSLLDTTFAFLRESALCQPEVIVHRDYHSRNLLILPGRSRPGVIDFQDAVIGPVTYDVVSLLKDCYIEWPAGRRNRWLEDYRLRSQKAGLHNADPDTFRQWFELMGMQRHLKASGIFSRLSLRDNKHGYLADIPRTVNYLVEASARQPALRHFTTFLTDTVVPAIELTLPTAPRHRAF